jgi:ribosomal protein L40E
MKKYCSSCGKQNPVSAKYCCHCGDGMSLAAKVKQKTHSPRADTLEDGEDEGEDEIVRITASKLDVEIMATPQMSETIGGLMQQGESSGPVTSQGYEIEGGPAPAINEKQFLDDFRKEAGPLRGDRTIGEK